MCYHIQAAHKRCCVLQVLYSMTAATADVVVLCGGSCSMSQGLLAAAAACHCCWLPHSAHPSRSRMASSPSLRVIMYTKA